MMNYLKTYYLLVLMCLLTLGMTGCNSREDVYLSSVDEITEYVEAVIDEPVKYVRTEKFVEHGWASYIYMLEDRNIEFEVKANIRADAFEALQLSNFREEIEVEYERAIMNDDYYVEERLNIAKKYDVTDEALGEKGKVSFHVNIDKFGELEKVVDYIKEVDELYSFKEKEPDKVEHIGISVISSIVGAIYSSENGGWFKFSWTREDEINTEEFLEQLQKMYVFYGDFRKKKDSSVPDELWNELLEKSSRHS